MTDDELFKWAERAVAGDRLLYFRGYLANEVGSGREKLKPKEKANARLSAAAMRLSDLGLVHLFQRKTGPGDYDYLAQRTPLSIRNIVLKQ